MTHPSTWLAPGARAVAMGTLLVLTVAIAVYLGRQGKPLREAVPGGILAYEFAWTRDGAQRLLNAWSADDLPAVLRRQLWWDFAFIAVYPLCLSMACALLAMTPHDRMAAVGVFIAWAVLLAAPLDATENVALLRMMDAGASDGLARLAGLCAGVKFVLVYSAFGYIVLQGISVAAGHLGRG
ncbi:MAG TPA: hypothetical protein VFH27_16235 [Longimicrobiaceae bacterium]|nr:hypothetical protein [Longimicrobiaceae bacterium]